MKKLFLPLTALLFAVVALSIQNFNFAQTSVPKLFAENVVNSAGDDYNPTFAPDGKTVYFARRQDRRGNETIMFSIMENGKWTEPKAAPFSVGKDKEPMFAPDGKRLFFASTRPNGRAARNDYDIWFVEKTTTGWSEPQNVGEVNSVGYDNYPAVAADGTLYFASVRIDGRKDNDLYRSRLVNGKYQTPENLGGAINTDATEADPFVAPDQSYMIFSSDRAGGAGEGDLYISFNQNGRWTAPQSLGANLNTADYEYTPTLSPDGKWFYFSRGWGDIYEIDAAALKLDALKKTAKEVVQTANKNPKYLFYLHGKIVEDQGAKAVSEKYGAYEYEKIVEGFRAEGFKVVSEARPKDTDVEAYAGKVAEQIRQLLKDGVSAENVTVVGASRGAFIAMLASTYLKNKNLNFVIIAGCGVNEEFLKMVDLHGNILSIYEKTDSVGTCQTVFDDATGINKRKEVMLETNLAHGFIYRPLKEWLIPTLDWAHSRK